MESSGKSKQSSSKRSNKKESSKISKPISPRHMKALRDLCNFKKSLSKKAFIRNTNVRLTPLLETENVTSPQPLRFYVQPTFVYTTEEYVEYLKETKPLFARFVLKSSVTDEYIKITTLKSSIIFDMIFDPHFDFEKLTDLDKSLVADEMSLIEEPEDKLDLTEDELSEGIVKVFTQTNNSFNRNLTEYSYKDGEYIPIPPDDTVILFSFEGYAMPKDELVIEEDFEQILSTDSKDATLLEVELKPLSDEDALKSSKKDIELSNEIEVNTDTDQDEINEDEHDAENEQAADNAEQEGNEEPSLQSSTTKKTKLINQFNFCERAALTVMIQTQSAETQTIPPPRSTFEGDALQWIIYDSYAADYEEQSKAKSKKSVTVKKDEDDCSDRRRAIENKLDKFNRKYLQSLNVIERMIHQNIDTIAHDCRYYEDPSDEYRDGEGTLLPLWKFVCEKTKKMIITDVCFNPTYFDLFAVTFRTYDLLKYGCDGAVCLFTIKNPSYPEYTIMVNTGITCCDIHPQYPNLMVIGTLIGDVLVYNLQSDTKKPAYMSHSFGNKHAESVMEVKWGPIMSDGEINFYSVSMDGKVFNWILMQNKLSVMTMITLYLDRSPLSGPDGSMIKLKDSGSCMVFHPNDPEIFLVGSEEGIIYKCTTSFNSKFLLSFRAHFLSIYRIDYNKFNSNIYISCGADWRVKVWEDMRLDPLLVFDLGSCVGDVKWAPFSSTVFAACTIEGKVFVFDLNVNKYKPLCIQSIVPKRRNKLTRLAFNRILPIIVVGDEKGTIHSLKLSPNLRLKVKPTKKQQNIEQHVLQVLKLDKLLSMVREIPEGEEVKDNITTSSH